MDTFLRVTKGHIRTNPPTHTNITAILWSLSKILTRIFTAAKMRPLIRTPVRLDHLFILENHSRQTGQILRIKRAQHIQIGIFLARQIIARPISIWFRGKETQINLIRRILVPHLCQLVSLNRSTNQVLIHLPHQTRPKMTVRVTCTWSILPPTEPIVHRCVLVRTLVRTHLPFVRLTLL